jgi:hypothetical protein
MTVNFVFQATPGAHVYRLCGLSALASTVFTRSLSAETSAVGATGGSTIARPADGGADNDLTTPR